MDACYTTCEDRPENNNATVVLSTNRNGRGGIQSPFLLNVDLSKNPVIKLNNLQLETAQSWTLMLMTPEKDQYMIKDQSAETGSITIDIVNSIKQNKQKNTGSLKLDGKNNIVLLFYAVSAQRKSSLSIDSIEMEYQKK
ncbi:MAG: hypothetical protein WDO16_02345 [Bacteroidota bacterium]